MVLLIVLLLAGVGASGDPYAEYEERLNQFVMDTLSLPVCDFYVELLRKKKPLNFFGYL